MNYALTYLGTSLASFYTLWIFYLAVMCLKRARDEGLLHKRALYFGMPVLVVGYVLDALINWLVLSLILLEMPRETTVTSRLKRHNKSVDGWRKSVAVWFEPLLDPFDPSGNHI